MRRNLGDRRGQAMVYYVLSEIKHRQQACREALQYAKLSLTICKTLDDKAGTAFSLQRIGDVWDCNDHHNKAIKAWHEALAIAQEISHGSLVSELTERLKGNSFRFD